MGSTTVVYSDPQFDPDARAKLGPSEFRAAVDFRNYAVADPPGGI